VPLKGWGGGREVWDLRDKLFLTAVFCRLDINGALGDRNKIDMFVNHSDTQNKHLNRVNSEL
jgi:hypothetical protein